MPIDLDLPERKQKVKDAFPPMWFTLYRVLYLTRDNGAFQDIAA